MQENEDILDVLRRFVGVAVPPDMEARILCSCRSNLLKQTCMETR